MINLRPNFNINPLTRFNFSTSPIKKYPNLAPLNCDTVTFTGAKQKQQSTTELTNEELIDMRMLNRAIHNEAVCKQVSREAGFAEIKLKDALAPYFDKMTTHKGDKQVNTIFGTFSRTKTGSSIKEKLMERYIQDNKATGRKNDSLECLFDKDYISRKIGDIVGYRIVLGDADSNSAGGIIDALIQAVNDGVLQINRIENYVPRSLDSKFKYVNEEDLERLRNAVNLKRLESNLEPIDVIYSPKKSGYMALHLDLDLSNLEGKKPGKGHLGELQLIGYDVSKLKDIEDLCYKLKNRNEKGEAIKEIKAGHYAYKPFEKHFYSCLDNPDFPNAKEAFGIYTQKAYFLQRIRPSIKSTKQYSRSYKFPTIEECGLKGQLPKGLDYNVLAQIKEACDVIYKNSPDVQI